MKISAIAVPLSISLLVAGCAHDPAFEQGRALIEAGNVETGLAKVEQAVKRDPANREYQVYYYRQRDIALHRYMAAAEQARIQDDWEGAETIYRRMIALDADNPRAKAGLTSLAIARRHRETLAQANELLQKGDLAAANAKVRRVLAEDGSDREAQRLERRIEERSMLELATRPRLAAVLRKPVSLEFRDASLRQVLDVLSHRVGLKFILDRDVKPDLRTTISVNDTALDEVLGFILTTNQLKQKVLNSNTLLIYPNTQAKIREYGDTVVKSFYLANADAKQTAEMIKALVKTKDMFVDEKRNLLMIRDTPDAVRMAERLVANQDLAEPEVMLEVEVMEVGTNVLKDLGIKYPDQINYSLVGAGGTPGTVTLPEWLNRSAGLVRMSVTDPFLALTLKDQIGSTNLLANPRIRVKNKEHAKIHIGDRVPVITTTTTATGFAAESVNYLDVGLKLDVEPTIYLEDEVGIKIGLEVSSIVRQVQSATGTLTYQIGTRTASTVLRLHDGETQVLAGLISDEDRRNVSQIPGLGDVPILGRLFGDHSDTSNKTEVVLLITPRIVRNLARPALRFEEFPGGTDAEIGAPPLRLTDSASSTSTAGLLLRPVPGSESVGRVLLSGPASVPRGRDFSIGLSVEGVQTLKSGNLDLRYDASALKFVRAEPGTLISVDPTQTSFRVGAPAGGGRLSVQFESKGALAGTGELAKLVFKPLQSAGTASVVRLEKATVVESDGKVVEARLPPPVSLNFAR